MNAKLGLTLAASLFLLAGCGGGGGGGGGGDDGGIDPDPSKLSVEVTGVTQTAGDRVVVAVVVKDEDSRSVDIAFGFSTDGLIWSPATLDSGSPAPTGIAATPSGTSYSFNWDVLTDLGVTDESDLRISVGTVSHAGDSDEDGPFAVTTFGELSSSALSSDVNADLGDNGTLDDFVLIDTRSPADHAKGAIPGALSILVDTILTNPSGALPYSTGTRLVFYCYGGT